MNQKEYNEAQKRIEHLTKSYSSLNKSEKQEFYYSERACEEYESRAHLNQILKSNINN